MANALTHFFACKRARQKIAMLTAYDASFAAKMVAAGVDCLLIGDSLGMVVAGHPSTKRVTLEQMVYHSAAVARGAPELWRIADLPFLSYCTPDEALSAARRLLGEGQANMVKMEGGLAAQCAVIHALSEQGIPVCAHLGLTPQTVDKLGGYRTVGRDKEERELLCDQAQAVCAAGADMLVLECVPPALAGEIARQLPIVVIGIGCGGKVDGQVLVCYDVLGLSPHIPYFAKNFLDETGDVQTAFSSYADAVRKRHFPDKIHAKN